MRLGCGRQWLLGAALAWVANGQQKEVLIQAVGSSGNGMFGTGNNVVSFTNSTQFTGGSPDAVLPLNLGAVAEPTVRKFSWQASAGASNFTVSLWQGDPVNSPVMVTKATPGNSGSARSLDKKRGVGKESVFGMGVVADADAKMDSRVPGDEAFQMTVTATTDSKSAETFGDVSFVDTELPEVYRNKKLYFKVEWSKGGKAGGVSYSRFFAFSSDDSQKGVLVQGGTFKVDQPAGDNVDASLDPSPTGTSSSSVPTTAVTGSNTPSSAAASPASGGSPALSSGAIAGIAVGGAAVLVLVGLVVWWLLRRRSRQQHGYDDPVSSAPYGSAGHGRTADLIAEKEATAGVAESSPHSPYSDDGQQPHENGAAVSTGSPVAAAAGAATAAAHRHQPHERSYTPYSDSPATPGHGTRSMGGDDESLGGARSATPAGGRYAHLMDETMTEEERARVEEEERQLDAAIEQAGSRQKNR